MTYQHNSAVQYMLYSKQNHYENKMDTYIALLRGINVGGKNILPMKELTMILYRLGLGNIKTYLQSGNVVFQSKKTSRRRLSNHISATIGESVGFTPHVFLLTLEELQDAIDSNPFPDGENEPKILHLFFLASCPNIPNLEKLQSIKTESERFKLIDRVFYIYTPNGIGRSKLASNVERALGVTSTARNWRSVSNIYKIASQLEAFQHKNQTFQRSS